MASEQQQQWGSRLGVILAVAGSAVGLGNFLRFPGQAASNGGGAFMIPYFISLLLLGIPIGWAEWTMGRYGGRKGFHGAPAIYGLFTGGSAGRYVGVLGVLIPVVVYFYYVIIETWCLQYVLTYLTEGGLGISTTAPIPDQVAASKAFFGEVAGTSADGANFTGGIRGGIYVWIVVSSINLWFVYRGLSKGIEFICNYAMPTMAVIGALVLVRVLTLGTPDPALPDQNVLNGLGFMWNPDFSALANPKTWLAASGQIFFSLSVGFGVIINYASYMKRRDDVVLSGLTATATNEFFEVALGGMITLTAAVVFLGPAITAQATGSSFNLGFNTLPVVFAHMPLGSAIAALWFFMLFLAAITSSLSMLQPAQAFLEESLAISRATATATLAVGCTIGNLFVLWFSKDLAALDTFDFWIGTVGIFLLATFQIISFGWIFGVDRGLEEAHEGAAIRIPPVYRFIIKYVSPTYLIVVFVAFLWTSAPEYAAKLAADRTTQFAFGLLAVVVALLLAATRIGERRWRAAGLDIDNKLPPADGAPPASMLG